MFREINVAGFVLKNGWVFCQITFLIYMIILAVMDIKRRQNYDLKKVIETCKKDVKKQKQAEKQKRIRKIEEKKKRDEAQENISEKAIFSPAEERISTDKISEICKEEQIYMKESTVKKVINRIKGDRWGKWDDLITEMDGHSTSGIL